MADDEIIVKKSLAYSKGLLRPTIVITLFTISAQAVGFLTQIIIAQAFGARADMDAFLAANTLPQYIISVLLGTLGVVFIPIFIDYIPNNKENEAWEVATSVINISALILMAFAFIGIIFADPLLRFTTPGLSSHSLHLATQVAMITWPTIIATGITNLLTGIYQAKHRFSWPAAIPLIGSILNLLLILILIRRLGIIGLAIASTASIVLQGILLSPIIIGKNHYHFRIQWHHPGVHQVFHLLWPLVVSGVLVRWTPIIDRYLASELSVGSIAHLGYATKLLAIFGMLISTGIATVIFPKMALNRAENDLEAFRETISKGLRTMWMIVAPVIFIGGVLALPLVTVLFQRGAFTVDDSLKVAGLLQIYIFSLAGSCIGSITGRAFYALKYVKIISFIGVIEAIVYAVYTPILTWYFGVSGIALGYVLYFTIGIVWHLPLIRKKAGNRGGRTVILSFCRILIAASVACVIAILGMKISQNNLIQLIVVTVIGMTSYIVILKILKSPELKC